MSPSLFNLYSEYLAKEALDGLGDFNNGRQIIQSVKYADDLVLMAKEETVLQGMIDKLTEIGRCYGMEMNVDKNKSNENFKTTIPSNNYDRPKKLENVEYLKYLGSILTNDGRFTREIKFRIAMAKATFNKKKTSLPVNWT